MTVFVLDSSALLRYADNEAGADRLDEVFNACADGQADVCISAVQWGEVAGVVRKRLGASGQKLILDGLMQLLPGIVPASAERAVHAAELRIDRKIAYADAFALDLAMESSDHVLVTADYDFKTVADLAQIEFLPLK